MKVRFWDGIDGVIGLTANADNAEEQKNLAKILEGLRKSYLITVEIKGKPYKGGIVHWHDGRRGFFRKKVTEFIEMNFWPAEK